MEFDTQLHDLSTYKFTSGVAPDAPFVFLGRIEEIKGPHLAIEIARRAGAKLIIAGNIPEEHRAWFDEMVAPFIDGSQVTFIGPVNDRQKSELLGQARALLMPIIWEEPFGLVMIEAMACGTPVIGMRRGAVPEVVATAPRASSVLRLTIWFARQMGWLDRSGRMPRAG